ncbi:hypothetical protein BDF14DRAFT_1716514 [Spinellus fusiger]|nr:hypothetical protein BDF14DRAFT_1716514 [Spinellus fusiger]
MPLTKDTIATGHGDKSHALLLKAGFIRQSSSGIYSLLPMGLRTIEKIENIIDEEMQAIGRSLESEDHYKDPYSWKRTGRWRGAQGEFFRLKDRKDSDLLLAPTHEEEITQLVASELRSTKQLPIRLYQIGRKFRDELRPRAGLLRGREFIMKDLYSFDATLQDAYSTYEEVTLAYKAIFGRLGTPFVVAEADSGNMGGSKSHEYHLVSSAGEDTLLTCTGCGYTANEELAVAHLKAPLLKERITPLSSVKAIEVGHTFYLGTKYSSALNCGYKTPASPDKVPAQMGCYGIGVSRLLSAVAEVHCDDRGLVWPFSIAPYRLCIIPTHDKNTEFQTLANQIYDQLKTVELLKKEVTIDDRKSGFGSKMKDAELIGYPYIAVVGQKTLSYQSVEVHKRTKGEKNTVTEIPLHELNAWLQQQIQ